MAKRLLLVAALIPTFFTFPALAQNPEQLLKDKFLGKLLVIRNFYLDPLLRYDASGQIKHHAIKGDWTLAQFKIDKVRLHSDGFELQGERVAIGWDNKKQSVAFFHIQPLLMKIEELPSTPLTESKVDELANQIFVVLRNEPDTVADYWHALVTGNVVVETDAKGHKTFHLKNRATGSAEKYDPCSSAPGNAAPVQAYTTQGSPICGAGGKVSPPKVLRQREPEFTPLARQLHYDGTTVLTATVNESGSIQDVQVLRPAGFGLDDAAVKAIKTWKFNPAKRDGKPVKTIVEIEVAYRYGP